jgi:hypothetical protein
VQKCYTSRLLENKRHVGFEVLTPVIMMSFVFWDLMPCSPLKVNYVSEEPVASIFRAKE